MTSEKSAWVVRPEEHEPMKVLGQRLAVLASADATGSVEVFFQMGIEGSGPIPHSHAWDEAYYLIDGAIEVTRPGQAPLTVSAGEFIYIPGGTVHGFRVTTVEARFLSINSGRGASGFFAEMAREVGDALDVPKILAIGQRHGIAVPPPPKVP